jgi:hypothetical protein
MARYWQSFAAIFSGLGFLLSALWHVEARIGQAFTIPEGTVPLHLVALGVGIPVVWVPTGLFLQRFTGRLGATSRGFQVWWNMVAGAPKWLIALAGASFVYATVNFLVMIPALSGGVESGNTLFELTLTGHAMAFYAFAALLNWAALVRQAAGFNWQCERGHRLLPTDSHCVECGAPNPISGKKT